MAVKLAEKSVERSSIPRRRLLAAAAGFALAAPGLRALRVAAAIESAARVLQPFLNTGQLQAASLFVQCCGVRGVRAFGAAKNSDAAFLLGSISKPIALTSLMTLHDEGLFGLDDLVCRYLPEFRGDGRERVTVRHLLTHVSGLPDQLPDNNALRARHASLADFVAGALRVPLDFAPGTRYQYSSMGTLLAAEIAQRLSGRDIRELVQDRVFTPLSMHNSALGVGRLRPEQMMRCQTEHAAPESGGGSADARSWDWNSDFWRQLGAPWGGMQSTAEDVGRWLQDLLHPSGRVLRYATATLMTQNQNPAGFESRGLGLDVGMNAIVAGCSERTFGHTGSTGTIALADPDLQLICVVLTSLPGAALPSGAHPRLLAARAILEEMRG
jgi:CubicO group peptidase (beta-lactamase class C family)